MLKLPRHLLVPGMTRRYAVDGSLDVHAAGDSVILEVSSEDEDGGGWIEDDEAAAWMPALLPWRAELARGDLRGLYLAWLAGAGSGMLGAGRPSARRPSGRVGSMKRPSRGPSISIASPVGRRSCGDRSGP